MTLRVAAAFVTALVTIIKLQSTVHVQVTASASDGVYTVSQATRGKTSYARYCASCHGADLTGGASGGDVAPPLTGDDFTKGLDGLTVGDLFERIRVSMPQDSPGTLNGQQTSDIVAFLLASNKLPAGATELAIDATALKTIKFAVKKPDGVRQHAATGIVVGSPIIENW